MIKEWHGSLMFRTRLYDMGLSGVFKKYQNKILGADFETANPLEVEDKLNILINDFYSLEKVTIEDIAKFPLEFEFIHPFQDGNGRIVYFPRKRGQTLGNKRKTVGRIDGRPLAKSCGQFVSNLSRSVKYSMGDDKHEEKR